jgi:glycosyltransferase involved in cell wall biosynthesis
MKKIMTKTQVLIIDCQVFQTASWHRGMGKYAKAFLGGIFANHGDYADTQLVFLFNDSLDPNKEAVDYITAECKDAEFIYAPLETPKEPRTENSIQPTIAANKKILNSLLAEKFHDPVSFLILALYLDEVCPVFPDTAHDKLVIYYDSIPYLYYQRYSQFAGFFEHFYMPHTVTVYEATKLLTISETVANDLHIIFGIPEEKICNINGASIPRPSTHIEKVDSLGIKPGKFILMPTGQELRKNNLRAVRAFEQFRAQHNHDVKLVITSSFTDEAQAEYKALSDYVVFSGNVSEAHMMWLFQNCQFVLFPSEYEGLGLPILEAVEQDKPIACSDISVFREMSKTAFSYFDPLNIDSIAETLETMYTSSHDTAALHKSYHGIVQKYTWHNTSLLFREALDRPRLTVSANKKKIAIFCPHPAGFSAIGKVVTESHAWYSQFFDITYYFDVGPNHAIMRPDLLSYLSESHDIESFKPADAERFDAMIYHIGNSEYHLNIIHIALALPGYVILHDTFLDGAYANLLEEGYMTAQRIGLEKSLDDLVPSLTEEGQRRSASLTSIVNNQLGVVTHSEYARTAVKDKLLQSTTRLKKINLPVDTPIFPEIVHGNGSQLNIAFAGIIAKVKGTDIIEDIAVSEEFANCNIRIFGYSAVEPERLEALRSLPHVTLITNPSDHEFQKLMSDTDILINVRLAYKGETSLTTLEAMRYGVAVLVRDFGWYGELEAGSVLTVNSPAATIKVLRELLADPEKLASIKRQALSYMERSFSHRQYAEEMYGFITE